MFTLSSRCGDQLFNVWLRIGVLTAVAAIGSVAPDAHAEVYKCESPKGVIYSDRPCGAKAKVIATEPAAKNSAPIKSSLENLDWKEICGTGDQQACIAAHQKTDASDAERIDSAKPIQLLLDLRTSCRQKDLTTLFSLHSKRVEQSVRGEDPIRQRQILELYCGRLRDLMANMKDDNPAFATYFTKQVPAARTSEVKSVLCILPDGSSQSKCELQFDVAEEDGLLKKDEL